MKFTIRARQVVFYEAVIEAETEDQARAKAQALIDEQGDPVEFREVDSDEMEIIPN
jgi:hypothetical protein